MNIYTKTRYLCPVCGHKDDDIEEGSAVGIEVDLPPYTGRYCIKCFAKWISETIPQYVVVKEEE